MEPIRKLFTKHREIVMYGIFGVLTTVVNYAAYLAGMAVLSGKYANVTSTCAAWVISVLFAYFTNRKWVFGSAAVGFAPRVRECAAFFAARIFSGVIDLAIMYAAVDVMGFDGRIVKLLSNVLVIIINYILSKFIIFKKAAD